LVFAADQQFFPYIFHFLNSFIWNNDDDASAPLTVGVDGDGDGGGDCNCDGGANICDDGAADINVVVDAFSRKGLMRIW